jgi:kinesin family protein 2/24
LAGSERYEDSKDHDKQRMDEVRENNKGLMNLKECVCAKAKMASDDGFVHIPWRAHKLTMLLKVSPAHFEDMHAEYSVSQSSTSNPASRPRPWSSPTSRHTSKTACIRRCTYCTPGTIALTFADITASMNTLSYAAPFMTVPPKPRGPAPYDTEDPRTWNHAQTTVWLAAQFAAALHLCPVGFAPEPGIDLGVELSAVCPPGATAAHLGRLYTTEFVARCLAARTGALSEERLTDIALDVIGTLFHMLMVAKNRTRRAIMESRTRVTDMSLHTPQATARRAAQVAAARGQAAVKAKAGD